MRNFAFFLIVIMYITQKCIIFAAYLKNDTKLQQNFYINKLKFKNYEKSLSINHY